MLSLISGPKASSKSGWSLVSKLIHSKRISCEEEDQETYMNEFAKVDAALSNLTSKSDNIICVQNQLKELESSIQDLEEGIECLSRHLIKSRVCLLNIFNN
ncbi:hypothetical protein EZV62_012000 [Acer yangbiense]|uniref:Uncharacterized protein n=1 Tax=Acer yangbiense TaxID=1000413 RepID=A0A5C7I9F5_9ROSI|nr:hypothetical protein EZV62_012000 [Acer yangbiense]